MTNLMLDLRAQGFSISYRDGGDVIKYELMQGPWDPKDFHRLFKLPWNKVTRILAHQCGYKSVEAFLCHLVYIGAVSQPHQGMYLNDNGTSQFV